MENQHIKNNELDSFFTVFFLLSVVFLSFEQKAIKNTINGLELLLKSFLIGLAVAIVFLAILIYQKPLIYSRSNSKLLLVFQIFFSITLFITATTNFINRNLSFENENYKNQSILKIDGDGGTGRRFKSNYSINLKIDNNPEQIFEIDCDLFLQLLVTGKVKICKRKGIFGYDYVSKFEAGR